MATTDGTTSQRRRVTRVAGGRVEERRVVEAVIADADTDVPSALGGASGAVIDVDAGALGAGRYFVAGGGLPTRPETTVEVVGVAGLPTAALALAPEGPTVHVGGATTCAGGRAGSDRRRPPGDAPRWRRHCRRRIGTAAVTAAPSLRAVVTTS